MAMYQNNKYLIYKRNSWWYLYQKDNNELFECYLGMYPTLHRAKADMVRMYNANNQN